MLKKYCKYLRYLLPYYFQKRFEINSLIPGTLSKKTQKNLSIEDEVTFGGNVLLFSTANITIGCNTMIAYGVVIHTSTHDYNCHPMWTKHIMRPVKIGKYVWIGTGAIILPGVIIKDHAVIAAGSVVNANVPEGAIVAGNPARIVKYRDPSIYKNKLPIIENRSEAEIINDTYLSNNCKLR